MKKLFFVILCILLVTGIGFTTEKTVNAMLPKTDNVDRNINDITYLSIREKIISGDKDISFRDFRLAYANSDFIKAGLTQTKLTEIADAIETQKPDQAKKLIEEYSILLFGEITFHKMAAEIYHAKSEFEKENFHANIYRQMLDSILLTGNGLTLYNSYELISFREENVVLDFLEYSISSRSTIMIDGQRYTYIKGQDRFGDRGRIYFNIDIPCTL